MPKCSRCGESSAFHELTNYSIPATPGETTERLCFRCVQIDRLQARDSQSITKVAELLAELGNIKDALPKTFFSHLPLVDRVKQLAEKHEKLLSMCQQFETYAENDAQRIALLEAKIETDAKSLVQFADERKAAVAEAERARKLLDDVMHAVPVDRCITFCGNHAQYVDAYITNQSLELERVQKQCAAMSDGLASVLSLIESSDGVYGLHLNGANADWPSLRTGGLYEDWLLKFDEALSTDAGRDYIAKEKVKPLVEALRVVDACERAHDSSAKKEDCFLCKALAAAKEAGL